MREIAAAEVLAVLGHHRESGLRVDDRLLKEVGRPGEMFVMSLATTNDFLSLVWQSIPAVRPLVPVGQPRTLGDCASRLVKFGWQFEQLVQNGYNWFQTCADIDEFFDYSKLGWIALTPLVDSEIRETPAGTYYIYDGVHKSLVLAKRLLRQEVNYKPLEVLLLRPRRY